MKASMIKGLGTLVAGLFAALAAPASAQVTSTANGPYYATPSWDQKLTTNRFVILANWNNEAVLDRETGLVWEMSPSASTATFQLADAFLCNGKNLGGRMGWRVPSLWELLTLVDKTQNPALPAGHPFNLGDPPRFWTNTPLSVGFGAQTVWVVVFDGGFARTTGPDGPRRAWCVRGPGGAAPTSPLIQ